MISESERISLIPDQRSSHIIMAWNTILASKVPWVVGDG
jgi:hypothetical protein